MAVALTGEGLFICDRPTGRSGWVTAKTTSTGDPGDSNASSVLTAKSGVPKKTAFGRD
jgi:hypothetical protein